MQDKVFAVFYHWVLCVCASMFECACLHVALHSGWFCQSYRVGAAHIFTERFKLEPSALCDPVPLRWLLFPPKGHCLCGSPYVLSWPMSPSHILIYLPISTPLSLLVSLDFNTHLSPQMSHHISHNSLFHPSDLNCSYVVMLSYKACNLLYFKQLNWISKVQLLC